MIQEKAVAKSETIDQEMPDLLAATFEFWYNDSGHIRSPFPLYIREELRKVATKKFTEWTSSISEKAKKEVNDEIIAEKLEEIIFEGAIPMVITEDEKLTILYPFLPRVGDVIKQKEAPEGKAESKVIDRKIEAKGDFKFMKVKLQNISSKEKWETDFELPA